MTDPIFVLAIALLVAGVFASLVPGVPGGLLTLVGLVVYWLGVGGLSAFVLGALVALVAVVLVLDVVATVVASRVGGGSWRAGVVGAVIGIALVFVLGPVGLLVGIAGTVFLIELRRGLAPRDALRVAAYTTVAVVASKGVQLIVYTLVLAVVVVFG